jgi:hypothetical protein
LVDDEAPGHAGDSREGDEEKNHRRIRRMFFRLMALASRKKSAKPGSNTGTDRFESKPHII